MVDGSSIPKNEQKPSLKNTGGSRQIVYHPYIFTFLVAWCFIQ